MESSDAPAVRPGLATFAAALLRLPEIALGGLRALALEAVLILGIGAAAAFVRYFIAGTPHIFADIWTGATYVSFLLGAPLAAQALLEDLRYPDLIDWWPGGTGTRTRFRMPSTTPVYLVFDAVPPLIALLALREPRTHIPLGYFTVAVTIAVCAAVAVLRVVARLRHGPTRRAAEESASVEVAPEGARAAAAVAGILVPLLAVVGGLAATHAGLGSWLLWGFGYLAFAALVKVAATPPRRALEPAADAPRPTKRRRK